MHIAIRKKSKPSGAARAVGEFWFGLVCVENLWPNWRGGLARLEVGQFLGELAGGTCLTFASYGFPLTYDSHGGCVAD